MRLALRAVAFSVCCILYSSNGVVPKDFVVFMLDFDRSWLRQYVTVGHQICASNSTSGGNTDVIFYGGVSLEERVRVTV